MKLWTWHKPDFSLLAGRVDHNRSEYVQTVEGVRDAYRELAARIGTSQLVWCNTVPGQRIVLTCHTDVEWILDVPRKSILQFVDDIVWSRILGIRCALPSEIRYRWREEALHYFPKDGAPRKRFLAEKENSFWTVLPPGKSWWDSLFVRVRASPYVSALVPHPVAADWVLVNPIRTC